jgi:hypothetical protein
MPVRLSVRLERGSAHARRHSGVVHPNLESRTLNDIVRGAIELPVPIRGRWLEVDHVGVRNAAWAVRNARWAGQDESRMIGWFCQEVRRVLDGGGRLKALSRRWLIFF